MEILARTKTMTNVTCTNCGWVHFAVTREYAEEESRKFMEFYETQPKRVQNCYGKNTTYYDVFANYVGCDLCKGNDFRPSVEGDVPNGCTIGPVIWENDV